MKKNHRLNVFVFLLLFGIGVSSIGDFIYLVALNVFILKQTESALAVAGIWVAGRIASLIVSPWAGSISDRLSYRKQLIVIELIRGILVGMIPIVSNTYITYTILFLLGAFGIFFNNAFLPYLTSLIPEDRRKTVNSLSSFLRYGAFLIGPTVAGFLMEVGNLSLAFWVDTVSFIISGVGFMLLPETSNHHRESTIILESVKKRKWIKIVKEDWRMVISFLRSRILFSTLYLLNTFIMILALLVDSQEVVFAKDALQLGDSGYSLMVFSAGMGFVAGSLILTFIAKHIGTKWLIGIGRFLSAFGYLIYALAPNFYWALGGLIILGLFGAMASIGFTTYIQNQVPLSMMGRINNVIGFFQQGLSIVFILAGGFLVSEYGIRILMVCTTILMLILSIILTGMILTEKRNSLFKDEIK
ncbi:conserved membrane hypothetical protein [[Clostridium] ultunense Esp]|nr:conserved membrane hypothetical protein [[Clostridium] ultunense Esp]